MAKVAAVCVSEGKGTPKHEVPEIRLREDYGIEGDAHAGNWRRQVSLLGVESVRKQGVGFGDLPAGAFAENILTEGITLYDLPVGTILQIGGTRLRITQIGKACHAGCAIRRQTGDCVMPREGVFAVVLQGGTVRPGDGISVVND